MTKRGVEGRAIRSQSGPDRPSPPGNKVAGDQTSVWPQGALTWVGTRPAYVSLMFSVGTAQSLWSMSSQQPLSAPCTKRQGGTT